MFGTAYEGIVSFSCNLKFSATLTSLPHWVLSWAG